MAVHWRTNTKRIQTLKNLELQQNSCSKANRAAIIYKNKFGMTLSAKLAAAAFAGTGLLAMPAFGEVKTFQSPLTPSAPYSGATRAGNMIFVGGIIGLEPNGKTLVPGGIYEEAKAAFNHVITMIERAGGTRSDIAKCVVLLSDINYFPEMNKVFTSYFPASPPTRSTIVVPAIPMNAAIEVECTALL